MIRSSKSSLRHFLLLELLVAISLISLFSFQLVFSPLKKIKHELRALEKSEHERIADLAFAEFKYKLLHNTLYTGYVVNKWNKACSANCRYCSKLETPKHLLFECDRMQVIWCRIGALLKVNIAWKHIVIGLEESNFNSKLVNLIISTIAYSIFCIWVKCSFSEAKYENVAIEDFIWARLIFYGKVLEKTNTYQQYGKRMLKIFN